MCFFRSKAVTYCLRAYLLVCVQKLYQKFSKLKNVGTAHYYYYYYYYYCALLNLLFIFGGVLCVCAAFTIAVRKVQPARK